MKAVQRLGILQLAIDAAESAQASDSLARRWGFDNAPRCGARNRRRLPCQSPAMHGKRRRRLHGGKSTGARTPEGLERIRRAVTKHGFYAQAAKAERRHARELVRQAKAMLRSRL